MYRALALRRSEELVLEISAFESLYSGLFTLSNQLIKPNFRVTGIHRLVLMQLFLKKY